MNFESAMITCAGRESMRFLTLDSLCETDWLRTPLISFDTSDAPTPQARQTSNALNALIMAINELKSEGKPIDSSSFIVFMEDDIVFNKHFLHNLNNWKPLVEAAKKGRPFFASLYNCNIRERMRNESEHFFHADPNAVYGSQCYVMNGLMAAHIVEHWAEVEGMQDIKMSRLAARIAPIHYHIPSLVQHTGVTSAWGGHFHTAKDFDANFKARALEQSSI